MLRPYQCPQPGRHITASQSPGSCQTTPCRPLRVRRLQGLQPVPRVLCHAAENLEPSLTARLLEVEPHRPKSGNVSSSSSSSSFDPDSEQVHCFSTGIDVSCVVEDSQNDKAVSSAQQTSIISDPVLQALLMVSPFAFWGTSMVVMKGLMTSVPPLVMGSFRLLPAGALLVGWAASQGRPQPNTWKAWAWVLAFALVDGAAFQGFLAEGLQRTPAGLGSVIIDSQPLTVAVLAAWLFKEHLGVAGIMGLFLGVGGLLLLELPEQYLLLAAQGLLGPLSPLTTTATDIASTAPAAMAALPDPGVLASSMQTAVTSAATQSSDLVGLSPAEVWERVSAPVMLTLGSPSAWVASGEFWMLAAAQAMAVGTVMVRYVTKHADPVMATGWHMIIGGLVLSALALADDPSAVANSLQGLGPWDYAAAAYVSLLGGAASYGIFFYLASSPGSLTRLSSLTFLTPVFAAVTGYFLLGEVLTAPQMLGGIITLGSVLLITSSKNTQQQQDTSSNNRNN